MIEILCTLTGIIAGIAVVASLMSQRESRTRFEAQAVDPGPERIRGIADQLQVISHRVAANVSAHSEKVENISGRLNEPSSTQPQEVLSTINEIIRANQDMQGQLADAQKRIAQQSQMIQQASQQARTDALTGLSNRRALDEFLTNCLETRAESEVVGLLLMDIDHFKSFNDSFGHTTGDAVLASFARAISTCCGQQCYAARFGGEEFAVIITGSTSEELSNKAAELRYFVSEQVISYEDLQLKITASAGLCILLPNDTINAAYERADEGLYQSKKAGRNCGFWLDNNAWAPFPRISGEPRTLSQLAALPNSSSESAGMAENKRKPSEQKPEFQQAALQAQTTVGKDVPQAVGNETKSPGIKSESESGTEILDLSAFLSRLEAYIQQLRRAELPATSLMVEAIGLRKENASLVAASWDETVAMVQKNLRGLDIVCQFRPFTLAIFMPGCSLDLGVERAAKIVHTFNENVGSWKSNIRPERLAISVGGVMDKEEAPAFLDRMEAALEEAGDASPAEVVVHNGDATHFQQV